MPDSYLGGYNPKQMGMMQNSYAKMMSHMGMGNNSNSYPFSNSPIGGMQMGQSQGESTLNSTVEYICNSYCWWDLPMLLMSSVGKSSQNNNLGGEGLTDEKNMESKNKVSKSDMNLELLKDYEYTTEEKVPAGEDKPVTVYICKYKNCNKEFTRTWNILDHARMHKGVKPYQCNYCMKTFTQKGNLRKHLKTHVMPSLDQRKRYKCEFCDSSYTERYNYKVS